MSLVELPDGTCRDCKRAPVVPGRRQCAACRAKDKAKPSAQPAARALRERRPTAQDAAEARAYEAEYYKAHPPEARARDTKWRAKHPEEWQEVKSQADLRRRQKRTGWTPAAYRAAHAKQQGLCAICGQPERVKGSLAADHDHATGVPRELLCFRCNKRLTSEMDEELWLEAALAYVRKHKGGPR